MADAFGSTGDGRRRRLRTARAAHLFDDWEEPESFVPEAATLTMASDLGPADDWEGTEADGVEGAPPNYGPGEGEPNPLGVEGPATDEAGAAEAPDAGSGGPDIGDQGATGAASAAPPLDGPCAVPETTAPDVLLTPTPVNVVLSGPLAPAACHEERLERRWSAGWLLVAAALAGAGLFASGAFAGRATAPRPTAPDAAEFAALRAALDQGRGRDEALARSVRTMNATLSGLALRPAPPTPEGLQGPIRSEGEPLRRSVEELRQAAAARPAEPTRADFDRLATQGREIDKKIDGLAAEVSKAAHEPAAKPLPAAAVAPLLPVLIAAYVRDDVVGVDSALKGLLPLEPQDARIWYLAGLARGYRTKEWQTDPVALARHGLELERKNLPAASDGEEFLCRLDSGSAAWLKSLRASPVK